MRAVVLQGERSITVDEVPDPTLPGPDGAIITVDRTAICGSDLHLYHGAMGGTNVRLGHEFVGTVVEVGPDVRTHAVGDKVLVNAGRLLRAALRTSDTVARLGGDEFTLIVENVTDTACAETVAEKIRSAFMPPVAIANGEAVFVTPSIGIALYPHDATEPEALLNAADAAMYDAKAAGRDAYSFYGSTPTIR